MTWSVFSHFDVLCFKGKIWVKLPPTLFFPTGHDNKLASVRSYSDQIRWCGKRCRVVQPCGSVTRHYSKQPGCETGEQDQIELS